MLSPEATNVHFTNQIDVSDTFNIMTYYYLYNGGGVATADLNNDGLDDLVFAGNQVPSCVYLNQGNMKFKDITESSGINTQQWILGVSVTDINADGWSDIYLSVGGPGCPEACRNLLYINQGNRSDNQIYFKEQAEAYGLDDSSYSVQATFLDYDQDGDLDMFLLTNIINNINKSFIIDRRLEPNQGKNADKLFENCYDEAKGHPVFTDVSEQAGIVHEGYGLGVVVDDMNTDGWPDIYVANDFMDSDYLYLNQQDGSGRAASTPGPASTVDRAVDSPRRGGRPGHSGFREEADRYLRHQSLNSMGVDAGDINNDLRPDIAVLDMLPPDNYRRKMMLTPLSEDTDIKRRESGYARQYIRNMLHLNQGERGFSEIGQLAGVDATDWSWAVLMADFDLDGQRDMFISNGIVKDMTDLDFIIYRSGQSMFGSDQTKEEKIRQLARDMKGAKTFNYFFQNRGDLTFTDRTADWGVEVPSFSNGAAYSDLDNDGDLDVVTNNINDPALIYENKFDRVARPYLKVNLKGEGQNLHGIGSKVVLFQNDQRQYAFLSPQKGYLSTVTRTLHFGLADTTLIDSLVIIWPDQQVQTVENVAPSQMLSVSYAPNRSDFKPQQPSVLPLRDASDTYNIAYQHQENRYDDFKNSPLLLRKYSSLGPSIAVGDVNGDQREDFFVGGSMGQSASFFIQQEGQKFAEVKFPYDSLMEDAGCLLFDKDNDGDLDLYVVSGGVEWGAKSEMYQDRLYENDGQGNFTPARDDLPTTTSSGSCVVAADYDQDGDLDLFVGGRLRPTDFPIPPTSYLLENENGKFIDVTQRDIGKPTSFGMVSAALWTDYDQDGQVDLLVASEWEEIQLFRNEGGHFQQEKILSGKSGWWNSLYGSDLDRDGDIDYILGNHGLNSRHRASQSEPIRMYAKDFDRNNETDAIITFTKADTEYVYHSRDALNDQIIAMSKRFGSYDAYAQASLNTVLLPHEREDASVWQVTELNNALIIREEGSSHFQSLPTPLQFAPITGVQSVPSASGTQLLLVGNFYEPETALGPYDAFNGAIIGFDSTLTDNIQSLNIPDDARSLAALTLNARKQAYLVGRNQGELMLCESEIPPRGYFTQLQPTDFYATIKLVDGRTYREEFYYGAGYLSQSSRTLFVPENAKEVVISRFDGQSRNLSLEKMAL
ncbi:MAG: VCBS repeat-containing protein [Bacteroidota bacterium]